jgi:hypothetical protein
LGVGFLDCKLQIFKNDFSESNSSWTYRFVVIDSNKSKGYPANFVCMLPVKLYSGKSKSPSAFGALFGEDGLNLAIGLLNDALKTEKDAEVRNEIEKRLKLLNPKEANVVKCSQCHKPFQPRKVRKYRQYLCNECVSLKFTPKTDRKAPSSEV